MTKAEQQLVEEHLAAFEQFGAQLVAQFNELGREANVTMKLVTEIMQADTAQRKKEVKDRARLARLMHDAGLATEMVARQSGYLARVCQYAEQHYSLSISPVELLCGILNGLQDSGLNLCECGTREDVADVVQGIIEIGIKKVRKMP